MRDRGKRAATVIAVALALLPTAPPWPAVANALPYYYLPWDADAQHYVYQGNNQGDHINMGAYAWDFSGDGWLVRAAIDGTVRWARDSQPPGGCDMNLAPNANYVAIDDSHGFRTLYLHLAQGSVTGRVSVNQAVTRGTPLGLTDNSGYSCGSHLHYQVESPCSNSWWCQSQGSSFLDPSVLQQQQSSSDGVPKTGEYVVSDNEWIKLTSGDFSFQVPPGYGGSLRGPNSGPNFSGSFNWQIRVTGLAGNYASTKWAGSLNLAPDTYQTTIYLVSVGCCGTQFQFYGTVCGQVSGCAQLTWPQPGGVITLGNDTYTAWSHLYN